VPRPSRSQHRRASPWQDPRLLDRQGDLRGASAFLLVLLMVGGVALLGGALVGVGRLVPTPAPTPAPTSAPVVTPTPLPASAAPSVLSSPTDGPAASDGAVVPDVLWVAAGDPAPITERGRQLGTVTIVSAGYRSRIAGQDPPSGRRWLRVSLRYRATLATPYEAGRWSARDASGKRYPWLGTRATDPALGAGTLAAGATRTGYVVFAVPTRVAIVSLVLQDADGHDIVIAAIP
jgi:hypothetical protein